LFIFEKWGESEWVVLKSKDCEQVTHRRGTERLGNDQWRVVTKAEEEEEKGGSGDRKGSEFAALAED